MKTALRTVPVIVIGLLCSTLYMPSVFGQERISVRVMPEQARAVLGILEKRWSKKEITEADWRKVFESEGYRRLKQREESMKRTFEDGDFREFVMSAELLGRYDTLKRTLAEWEKLDATSEGAKALAYLPDSAVIKAKVYPVIKPLENSFVFDIANDPAIFLYLDPAVTKEQFGNTLAHELHHVGFGTACPNAKAAKQIESLSPEKRTVLTWLGAFGEGLAMLAAAGGPDVHPHLHSKAEDRERWDRDVRNFNDDLKKVESFFLDVLAKRLEDEKAREIAFSFFGTQGPWYTVGWQMSATIEKAFGRRKLIEVFCDTRSLLSTYNEAAAIQNKKTKSNLAVWSDELTGHFK